MNQDNLSKAIKEITKCLELSEPSGFMLSYDFNDIWLDISLEKNEYGEWDHKTYTMSMIKSKAQNLLKHVSNLDVDIFEEGDRIYVQLTEEEWNSIQDFIFDII